MNGLEIRDASGRITYSTADVTWLILDVFIVDANTSTSKTYYGLSEFNKMKWHVQLVNTPPDDQEGYSPLVTGGLGSISVVPNSSGRSEAAIITVLVQ